MEKRENPNRREGRRRKRWRGKPREGWEREREPERERGSPDFGSAASGYNLFG